MPYVNQSIRRWIRFFWAAAIFNFVVDFNASASDILVCKTRLDSSSICIRNSAILIFNLPAKINLIR